MRLNWIAVVVLVALGLLAGTATAQAASVAYLDGNEIWVATTDGVSRARLSAGEGDWRAVAQSDLGYIVGVRLEAGKISNLSTFTVWDPAGKLIHFGPLAGNSNGSSAYPLSLDITPDGGLLVYGYSRYVYGYPVGSLTQGHYLLPSATRSAPVPEPYSNSSIQWPTLVGERIVGTPDQTINSVQEAGSIGGTNFVPWMDFSGVTGFKLDQTDVAATGTVFAAELREDVPSGAYKVAMVATQGLGLAPLPGDCFLAAEGSARQPSVSQDATLVAWQDGGGVKVGGVPNFSGADPCVPVTPPVTISATGSYPSIGPFNVAAFTPPLPVPPASTPGPAPGLNVAAPATFNLAKMLKSGLVVSVSSAKGGKASLRLTVSPKMVGRKGRKPIVIATGSAVVPAGGVVRKIKLKMTAKGTSLRRRLRGKRATLTVTIGGASTTKKIKLK